MIKFYIIILATILYSTQSLASDDIYTDGCNPSPYTAGCGGGLVNLRRQKLSKKKKLIIEDIRVKLKKATLRQKLKDAMDKSLKNSSNSDMNKEIPAIELKKEDSLEEIVKDFLINPKILQTRSYDEERLDSIKTNTQGVIYNITLLKFSTNDSKIESSKIDFSTKSLRDQYCYTTSVKRLREAGFNITNSYKAINGDLLYEVTTTPSDCQ